MSALLIAAVLVSSSTTALSTSSGDDPLDQYLESQLELRYSVGFFGPVKVVRQGESVDLGMFGAHAETIFEGSNDALDSMDTFRALRIGGFTVWTIGLGVLITEVVLLIADKDILLDSGGAPNEIFWVMLLSGAVVGAGGGIAMNASNDALNDAVQSYNQDLLRRIRGVGPGGPKLGFRLSF